MLYLHETQIRESPTKKSANAGESGKSLIPRLVVVSGLMLPKKCIRQDTLRRLETKRTGCHSGQRRKGRRLWHYPGMGWLDNIQPNQVVSRYPARPHF